MTYQPVNISGTKYRVVGEKEGDYLVIEAEGHPIDVVELAPGSVRSLETGWQLVTNARGEVGGRHIHNSSLMQRILHTP